MMTITVTHSAPQRSEHRCEQAEPGVGYRLLEAYEVIERTDEVWSFLYNCWRVNNAKNGRPLLTHWRPRRRKLPAATFPAYWLNGDVVYRAANKDCPGSLWSDRINGWCRCADNGSLVEHVKDYPDNYKPITREQARDVIGDEALDNERSVQELYNELLFAVASKFPDETRHQTALRYISEAESSRGSTGSLIEAIASLSKSVYGI
jgi:hypothetical protein